MVKKNNDEKTIANRSGKNDHPERLSRLKPINSSVVFSIVLMFFVSILLAGGEFSKGYWFLWFLAMLCLFFLLPELKRRRRSRSTSKKK